VFVGDYVVSLGEHIVSAHGDDHTVDPPRVAFRLQVEGAAVDAQARYVGRSDRARTDQIG